MRTHPHEQLSSHTPVTQPLTTLWSGHLSTQTSRLENNFSHFIFCTIPLHINRNWMSQLKWCLKANLLFSDFYATVSNHKIWNGTFTFSLLCGHEWISCWISFHNFLWNNISGSSAPKHGGIFLKFQTKYFHLYFFLGASKKKYCNINVIFHLCVFVLIVHVLGPLIPPLWYGLTLVDDNFKGSSGKYMLEWLRIE